MNPIERELLKECRSIVENTLYNYDKAELIKDIWTTEEREQLAQQYFEHAKSGLEYLGSEHDPRIALRAVRYLASRAIPPMEKDTEWFKEGLLILLELACPYTASPQEGEPFFDDIRNGMEQADAWGQEDEKT